MRSVERHNSNDADDMYTTATTFLTVNAITTCRRRIEEKEEEGNKMVQLRDEKDELIQWSVATVTTIWPSNCIRRRRRLLPPESIGMRTFCSLIRNKERKQQVDK